MMSKDKLLLQKDDTKVFFKRTNQYFLRFIFYAFKNLFSPKDFIRYIKKANSVLGNKYKNNYPHDFKLGNKRIAVYTALYGNYDTIKAIRTKNSLCDYFIFTDQKLPPNCGWQLRRFAFDENFNFDPIYKNRFLKMHPHLLFPEYDYSIYIDATIVIDLDIVRLFSRVGDKCLALFKHHAGVKCAYEEADRVKRIGIASEEAVDRQMNRYIKEGFPKKFGFYENSIIVRKHNSIDCISIMNTWWNEFVNETKRDQLSFTYSVWKNKKTKKDIATLGLTFWIEPILYGQGHLAKRIKEK